MEKLLEDSINFLNSINDDTWNLYFSTMAVELVIPKSKKALRDYNLKIYKPLIKANNIFKLATVPLMKLASPIIDKDLTTPFLDYFNKEKEVLLKLKKLLYSKSKEIPYISYCGVYLLTLGYTHTINKDRIDNINSLCYMSYKNNVSITYPEGTLIPINTELVNNMNVTFDKVLTKSKETY